VRARLLPSFLAAVSFLWAAPLSVAADLSIQNTNSPGFTDQTPVPPLLLNFGTTRGDQALIVFQTAAAMWGAALKSAVPIPIDSEFDSVTTNSTFACSADGTVLAYTTPAGYLVDPDFPNPAAGYDIPLSNALLGTDTTPGMAQFQVNINGDLGTTKCDFPAGWYFGLDTDIPASQISLLTTLLHEFGHGVGYSSLVNPQTGQTNGPFAIFDYHIFDVQAGMPWTGDSSATRKALITTPSSVAFDGEAVRTDIPTYLGFPPDLVTTFHATSTQLNFAQGEFSGPLVGTGPLVQADPLDACTDLINAAAISGNFALIERSFADAGVVCTFLSKAERAADAGAIGVIIFDYLGEGLIEMAGTPALSIPATFISSLDGTTLEDELAQGSGPVTAAFGIGTQRSNTDPSGTRVLLYTPTMLSPGSSLIHWNSNSYPHTLMLEFANQDDIRLNMDFTPDVMSDLGWSIVTGLGVGVVKLLDPDVPVGGQFSYLIAVLNRRSTPIDNVTVDLALPAGTTFISNASSPAGCATAFPCALGTMQAGEVELIVTTLQAPLNATSPFVATATLTPSSANANDNLTASSTQTVATGGDVQVTVTGPATLTAGTTATITTAVTNNGPGDAAGVTLAGTVAGTSATLPTLSSNSGACAIAFPCALKTIPAGTTQRVASTFSVPAGFQSGATFTATANSVTPDTNMSNNTASFVFAVGTNPALGGKSGCSSTGEPATMLGLLGLALALTLRRRRDTF
jgi:MYXO-CTERM domain-containing protein/uncharacterized repeat protein (TIGR01451 family)